jgi:hypothetical protein
MIVVLLIGVFFLGVGYGILITSIINANKRIEKLEEAQAKRLPHKTAAAIEDSISALLNARRLQEELKNDADALGFWLEKSALFSQGARGNAAYDMEEPSGNKSKRK